MTRRTKTEKTVALFVGLLLLSGVIRPAIAGDAEDYERLRRVAVEKGKQAIRKLIAERAGGIVTIKFILKHSFMGEESKEEMEAVGIMAGADGLVLGANSTMAGMAAELGAFYSGMGEAAPGGSVDTVDYRITIGAETQEYPAKLIARDSDLDLAWLQVTDAKGKTFQHIDFGEGVPLEVGDRYHTLLRLGDRFERAPVVYEGVVGGAVEKPRPLLVAGFGLPAGSVVFDQDAKTAGFVIAQPPERGDPGAAGEDYVSAAVTFILPAEKVVKALEQARQAARKQTEESEK